MTKPLDKLRIVIDPAEHGEDHAAALRAGFRCLLKRAEDPASLPVIVVGSQRQLEMGYLAELFGAAAKWVAKHREAVFPVEGRGELRIPIHLTTKNDVPMTATDVLAIWLGAEMLGKVVGRYSTQNVICVSWTPKDAASLRDQFGFVGENAGRSTPPSNPIVRRAMRTLDIVANRSTGVTHPSDRAAFVEILYLLEEKGVQFTAGEIASELSALGWAVGRAKEASDMAAKFLKGHRFVRSKSPPLREGIFESWAAGDPEEDRT